ncbi:MAG: nucleotidyltransferase [Candidatus Omnitrophica bacterium]|nr:nucleotidyltransferase [Candidatus Omnitrophota bacterium]
MIQKLIVKLAEELDKRKISYMLIGGQAVLIHGSPRLTRDIDITLGISALDYRQIKDLCVHLRLKILTDDPEKFAGDTNVLPAEDPGTGIRVDFIFSFTPYEAQAIKRARRVKIGGYDVNFASCEDLIIHKIFAAREIDKDDAKNILVKNLAKIDISYVEKWLKEFSAIPGQENISMIFSNILKDVRTHNA